MPKKSSVASSTTNGIVLTSALWKPKVEVPLGVTVANYNPNGTGLYGDGSAKWAVTNFGVISGAGAGVRLLSGSVTNYGSIVAKTGVGIRISDTGDVSGTVTNHGSISGRAVYLNVGVEISSGGNVLGKVVNDGLIVGGIRVSGGGKVSARISNEGDIRNASFGSSGRSFGISVTGTSTSGTVTNNGIIAGVYLKGSREVSARITNSGTISRSGPNGATPLFIFGGTVVTELTNTGAIRGGTDVGAGVAIQAFNDVFTRITNEGSIVGGRNSVGIGISGGGAVFVEVINHGVLHGRSVLISP